MVKEVDKDGQKLYQCEECGLKYAQKETAEKCEAWCRPSNPSGRPELMSNGREHKSCNLEIIKEANDYQN